LREEKRRHQTEKLGFTDIWINWHWVPAVYWSSKLDSLTSIFVDDRRPSSGEYYITDKEFAHRIAIIVTSATVFGAGIGEVIKALVYG